ncbi:hypothetical protein EP331_13715 [bacterium]|nr:MAG: hypothetical protein EP331_13715 [bacterium]
MNILLADSGSTKTEWSFFSTESKQVDVKSLITKGLNPYYHTSSSIREVLLEVSHEFGSTSPTHIYFYGAGCSLPDKKQFISTSINEVFSTDFIEVNDDLLGAARAVCGHQAGIAAILGTGSNSCFYDGEKIAQNVPSLGFILGDEGSGVHIGKALLKAYFYGELPEEIATELRAKFDMSRSSILDKVYRGELPNRFIASFTKITHDYCTDPYIIELIRQSFDLFIQSQILKYPIDEKTTIGFIGSVAYEHQSIMREVLAKHSIKAGLFLKNPMPKLIEFHSLVHEKSN